MSVSSPSPRANGLFDLRLIRVIGAACLALALCLVFATRVFVSFDALRVKLVRVPVAASDGTVRIDTASDARAAKLDAPVALVAVIHNHGDQEAEFSIAADGQPVCASPVPARSEKRVDCVMSGRWTRGPSHTLVITSATTRWSLAFLEIATHHGSSSRLIPFFVLPDITTTWHRPSWPALAVAWIVLGFLFLVRPMALPRLAVRVYVFAAAIALTFLAATVLSPWLTRFLLVMPVESFVVASAVLLAPRLFRVGTTAAAWARSVRWSERLWRPGVAVAGVSILVLSLYALAVRDSVHEFGGNYAGLLRISEAGFDQSPLFHDRSDVRETLTLLPNEGYDGQFMYFAAFDPFLRRFRDDPQRYRTVVDAPPYRFGRIGMPWMVRVVAGSRWSWYPVVMIGLVLLGAAACAAVIARLAQMSGMSPLWGLVVLAVPGFWQSVRVVLPEPLAAAMLLLGYLAIVRRRIALAVVLLAASLLIRETGLVLVVVLALLLPASMVTARGRLAIASAILPLVAWRVHVAASLWADWGWEGLFYSSHNVSAPFLGIVRLWGAVRAGVYHPSVPELSTAAVWFPLVLVFVAAVAIALRHRLGRHIGVALGVYTLLALSLTFPKVWGHVGNAQRTSYEAFVLLALASVSASTMTPLQRRLVIACWLASGAFVLFGAHDSLGIRTALFPW